MGKWLLAVVLGVLLLGLLAPHLAKLGLWRLPGDLRFRRNGRDYYLPITSTILLSIALSLALRFFRI